MSNSSCFPIDGKIGGECTTDIASRLDKRRKKHVLMTCIHARGHAAPMMALAAELARRGHDVTFVGPGDKVFEQSGGLWEASGHDLVQFIHPMHLETFQDGVLNHANMTQKMIQFSNDDNVLHTLQDIGKALAMLYKPLFQCLDNLLLYEGTGAHKGDGGDNNNNNCTPSFTTAVDLVISDYATVPGWDVATKHNKPLLLNWPGIKNPHHAAAYASFLLFDFQVPIKNPVLRFLNHFLFHLLVYPMDVIGTPYRKLRHELMAPVAKPVNPIVMSWKHPILYNTAIGISELAQPHSPLEHFVGALLPDKDSNRLSDTEQLSTEILTWFDAINPSQHVVFINFGTTGMVPLWKYNAIMEAMDGMPDDRRPFVIWRMPKAQKVALGLNDDIKSLRPYVKFVEWITPSQRAILCHPRVSLFVTHGGLNSPQEGIECGTPLLVVPAFGDQAAHAARLEASGVARALFRHWSPNDFREKLDSLLYSNDASLVKEKIEWARGVLEGVGGTKAAADVVEHTLTNGYSHLIPSDEEFPFWKRVAVLDVTLGYLVLAWVSLLVIRKVVGKFRPHQNKSSKAQR